MKIRKIKPIIAKCFKEWLKQASSYDLQRFCDDVNNFAYVLKNNNAVNNAIGMPKEYKKGKI